MFDHTFFDNHERVTHHWDASSGLCAIVAVHSTVRGPSAGGCRFWPYATADEALTDALRLSRGMSFKNAMAGLPLGGGKAVVIVDPHREKTPAQLHAFGRLVNSLGGTYITAEDVGASVEDMEIIGAETPFVSGLPRTAVTSDGNPAPQTALGVYLGIKASVAFKLGRTDLDGVSVAVQGLGGVGYQLCRLLAADGVKLRVADLRSDVVEKACKEFDAKSADVATVLFEEVDVVSPCALGGVLSASTIPRLRTGIVAGAANNQLATAADGAQLYSAGILYAPDYVVNAGGIISVGREYLGGATSASIDTEIRKIPDRLIRLFERAAARNQPPSDCADDMARELLRADPA